MIKFSNKFTILFSNHWKPFNVYLHIVQANEFLFQSFKYEKNYSYLRVFIYLRINGQRAYTVYKLGMHRLVEPVPAGTRGFWGTGTRTGTGQKILPVPVLSGIESKLFDVISAHWARLYPHMLKR